MMLEQVLRESGKACTVEVGADKHMNFGLEGASPLKPGFTLMIIT